MPTELTETMRGIREQQSRPWRPVPVNAPGAAEIPDTLVIACIDARLDPQKDIGIPLGRALLYRTISALVPDKAEDEGEMAEALNYALSRNIKHIILLNHTHCGGLGACLDHTDETLPAVRDHLLPIHKTRDAICGQPDIKDPQRITHLEEESIAQSLRNLREYPGVAEAMKAHNLDIHGWISDTVTHHIREMDLTTLDNGPVTFRQMARTAPAAPGNDVKADTIDCVRAFQPQRPSGDPLVHAPEMLILGDMDANYNPAPYGKALIYRHRMTPDSPVSKGKKAALEFAITAKGVKDIVVMGHTDNDLFADREPNDQKRLNEELVRKQVALINDQLTVSGLADGVTLHGWLFDGKTKRISELENGQFVPMGMKPDTVEQVRR